MPFHKVTATVSVLRTLHSSIWIEPVGFSRLRCEM